MSGVDHAEIRRTLTKSIALDKLLAAAVGAEKKDDSMPPLVEIKGLGSAVTQVKKGISDAREALGTMNTEAAAFVATVNDVTKQIKAAHEDVKFEASTLGNGGPSSNEQSTQSSDVDKNP